MKTRSVLATCAITVAISSAVRGDVIYGDFNSGTAPGWGALTNSGVQPWADPISGAVVPGTGPLTGSNVLQLTGPASFNFGQGSGAALGFDFLSQNLRNDFLAHDQLEFDWYVPPNGSTSGWNELFNIILNSEGGGFVNVAGHTQGTPNTQQFYFAGYGGTLRHVVVDYTAYKNAVLASAFPNGGGWLQFGIQPNAGGYSDGLTTAQWEFDNFKLTVAPEIWNVDADGAWSTDSNWSRGVNPNAPGKVATFGPVITAPRTVTVDAARTVGQINFDNANKYTIAGTGALTLDSTSAVGITVSAGNHDLAAPLSLAKDATIAVSAADSTLTLSNLQASPVAMTKTGAGTLKVNHVRANSLSVQGGTVAVLPDAAAAGTSKVGTLSIAPTAKLDLAANKLIVDNGNAGTATGGVYDGIQGLVQSGYAGGAWNGNGINSSSAAAVPAGEASTAIGVATGAQVNPSLATPGNTALFGGQTITGSSVIAMYTYGGDANLDGLVSGDDYTAIDFAIAVPGASGWVNGDFNYDGIISGDDYTIIDFNIAAQGAAFPTGGAASGAVAAVPEPSAFGFAALAAATLLGRRRRK